MSEYQIRRELCKRIHNAVPPVIKIPPREPPKAHCEKCEWRSGDRPCVWPKGVCGL